MRRDEPNRHGRAADALIASYLRELLLEGDGEETPAEALPVAAAEAPHAPPATPPSAPAAA